MSGLTTEREQELRAAAANGGIAFENTGELRALFAGIDADRQQLAAAQAEATSLRRWVERQCERADDLQFCYDRLKEARAADQETARGICERFRQDVLAAKADLAAARGERDEALSVVAALRSEPEAERQRELAEHHQRVRQLAENEAWQLRTDLDAACAVFWRLVARELRWKAEWQTTVRLLADRTHERDALAAELREERERTWQFVEYAAGLEDESEALCTDYAKVHALATEAASFEGDLYEARSEQEALRVKADEMKEMADRHFANMLDAWGERDAARADLARLKPVVEAARITVAAWYEDDPGIKLAEPFAALDKLRDAVRAALPASPSPSTAGVERVTARQLGAMASFCWVPGCGEENPCPSHDHVARPLADVLAIWPKPRRVVTTIDGPQCAECGHPGASPPAAEPAPVEPVAPAEDDEGCSLCVETEWKHGCPRCGGKGEWVSK